MVFPKVYEIFKESYSPYQPVSNRIICSTKPIDATILWRLLALAEKYGTRQICKNLLKTGCSKRNLETFKWKVKSNRSLSRC